MKLPLITFFAFAVPSIACAQLQTYDYYLNVSHATYVETNALPDGSFELEMGEVYHFDPEGKLAEKTTEPDKAWLMKFGYMTVRDEKNHLVYKLAPKKEGKKPWGFGVLSKENTLTKQIDYITYKDPDAEAFNETGGVAGSRMGYIAENGDVIFIMGASGSSAMGPAAVEGNYNDFVKRYIYHPQSGTMELSLHLANKIPVKMPEDLYGFQSHPEVLGRIGQKLYVVYNYSEGKESGERTLDVWSLDLETLEETREYSETYKMAGEMSVDNELHLSSDPLKSGLMFYMTDEKIVKQDEKGAVYHVVWVRPDQQVQRIDIDIPVETLSFNYMPPMLHCYAKEEQLHFSLIAENKKSRDMLIMTCDKDGGSFTYTVEPNCDVEDWPSYALFFDPRVEDMAAAYREVVYEKQDKICGTCHKYKTESYFVDENNVAHLFIIEYLTPMRCPDINDCVIRNAHVRVVTKQL